MRGDQAGICCGKVGKFPHFFFSLEVWAIIWPKKKTVHMKLTPICFLFPNVLVCFPCVTKQQMLVQVVRVFL